MQSMLGSDNIKACRPWTQSEVRYNYLVYKSRYMPISKGYHCFIFNLLLILHIEKTPSLIFNINQNA